ncbi:uncharacterized protein FA14DRAFT_175844 [Meira miltonrushii]|uniref:Uncharacterized protein n=1 Tax=Meira miltonrushii TaxID=1280837 RepID=A0A316VG27_9BASI|nr:uncharacterized protein FA14DRAFT_175844 [Meira miltonrushii]PWN36532.1 hypothetical protein FA14DRAFT_175844 [Meira miltonrushii]
MLVWILFATIVLLSCLSSASPPGSPQSQGSSTGDLLIDNPQSEYFRHSPTLHVAQSTGGNAAIQTKHEEKPKSRSPSPSGELLVDNPNSEYFHHSPTLHVSPSIGRHAETQTVHEKEPKSRSPSPSLPHEVRNSNPAFDSASIQHRLMTDSRMDYYHYIRLLSPKVHLHANSPAKERDKEGMSSSQSVAQRGPLRTRKRRAILTDGEKREKYEARLVTQRSKMSDRRKNALSGDNAKEFLRKHNKAVSDWRERKKVQDPNYFKAKYRILKWRERMEDQFGVKMPREKGGRPRKSTSEKQNPPGKKSKK